MTVTYHSRAANVSNIAQINANNSHRWNFPNGCSIRASRTSMRRTRTWSASNSSGSIVERADRSTNVAEFRLNMVFDISGPYQKAKRNIESQLRYQCSKMY